MRDRPLREILLWTCLAAVVIRALIVLISGLDQPLLDLHAFRQTQTALSVHWILVNGPALVYETPVLGAPWTVPFEFPLYQFIVALLAVTGVSIEVAGRLVSFSFFIATLLPLATLLRTYDAGRIAFLCTAILFVSSPLYLYWSRTVLVESCALFFSVSALALLAVYLRGCALSAAIAAAACGSAAILAKATTFPPFALIGFIMVAAASIERFRCERSPRLVVSAIVPMLTLAIPFLIGLAWVAYSDHVKQLGAFSRLLTSSNLSAWNLGTAAQRISGTLWRDSIVSRVLPDLFGSAWILAIATLGAGFAAPAPRLAAATLLAVLGFILPFLIFTNLHIVHNYYQYANGLFIISASGLGLGMLVAQRKVLQTGIGFAVLAGLLTAQTMQFQSAFAPSIYASYAQDPRHQAARYVKEHTPPLSSLLVIGDDWASIIPFYAERKSLALPSWTPTGLLESVLADPQAFLGDRRLDGIVACRSGIASYKQNSGAIDRFLQTRRMIASFPPCDVYR